MDPRRFECISDDVCYKLYYIIYLVSYNILIFYDLWYILKSINTMINIILLIRPIINKT